MKLKTYHGIQWLENQGDTRSSAMSSPYYGVHRAEAGDIDGDGDLDLAACAFLPQLPKETRQKLHLSGIAWYEQTADHQWRLHPIANLSCDFPTLDLGDFNGDGRLDIITAALMARPDPTAARRPRRDLEATSETLISSSGCRVSGACCRNRSDAVPTLPRETRPPVLRTRRGAPHSFGF